MRRRAAGPPRPGRRPPRLAVRALACLLAAAPPAAAVPLHARGGQAVLGPETCGVVPLKSLLKYATILNFLYSLLLDLLF